MTVTETRTADAPEQYRLGAGAANGLWLGFGATRIAVLAGGLLLTVALLAVRTALPVCLLPLVAAAAVALLPVAGRPAAGWAGPAATHVTGGTTGAARWHAPLPHHSLTRDGWLQQERLGLPPECGRVRLAAANDGSGGWPFAVLLDDRAASPVVCFAVAGTDRFSLLDADGQDRLVAGWGRALATLSQRDAAASHVQLLDRVSVAERDTDEAVAWARSHGNDDASLPCVVETVTARRDSVIAVRLDRMRDPREVTARARDLATQLLAADLVARPLGVEELRHLLSRLLTPGLPAATAPGSRRTGWDHVRIDDTWHRSHVVAGWPGSPVPAGWLAPLLLGAPPSGAWTAAVHLRAVPPEQATRIARAARARAELDRADRARLGLAASAAADQAVADSAGMDAELVAGHATHRLAAVLTCAAPSLRELDESSRALRDAASSAGVSVTPLHGQHHLALAATLPLCRLRFGGAL